MEKHGCRSKILTNETKIIEQNKIKNLKYLNITLVISPLSMIGTWKREGIISSLNNFLSLQ